MSTTSRRLEFLGQLGAGLLSAAYGGVPALPYGVRPGDAGYDAARQNNNARLNFHPDLIAYCQGPEDVSSAVRWATARGKAVTVRGGGHDYEGFSLNDGGVVIDLARYSGTVENAAATRAVIRAGTTLGAMYHDLDRAHVTLPGGTCPTVGVTGLTTGGGYGMLVRSHGLMSDRLRRITLVDADGRVRDSSSDPLGEEMLWACRGGGGGSFGVVTDLEFQVIPQPERVTYFSLRWKWDASTAATLLDRWMAWGSNAPREVTSSLTLQGGSGRGIHVFGQFLGDPGRMTALLDALSKGTRTTESVCTAMSFMGAVDVFAGPPSPRQPWKKKSSFGARALSSSGFSAVIDRLESAPAAVTCLLSFDTFGGAVNDVAAERTAFAHRDMSYLLQYQTYWARERDADAALAWIKRAFDAIDPHTAMKSYRNYCDLDLADWQRRYFGDNYARLQAIKGRLDPGDVFRYPQSIKLPA